MTAKFAVALVATTMFVAPALAADAVNSAAPANSAAAPAANAAQPAAAPTTATPAVSTDKSGKAAADTGTNGTERKVERRHVHRTMMAHKGKTQGKTQGKTYVKTVKVERSVKVVKSHQQAWPFGPFTWSSPEKSTVVHHHVHHMMVARGHKPSDEAKTVKTVGAASAGAAAAPAAASTTKPDASKPAAKVIKADKDLKNGGKSGYIDSTRGQAAPGAGAPAGTSNKDAGKVN